MELYEVKVSYNEYVGAKRKKMKRSYIVEAFSLTDVDATMSEVIGNESLEDAQITSTRLAQVNEIFGEENHHYDGEPKWYKCKVLIGDTDSEKVSSNIMLVKGTSLGNAISELKRFMADTIADWDSVSAAETNIFDVIRKH